MKRYLRLAPIALLAACASSQPDTLVYEPVKPDPEIRIVEKPVYVIEPAPEPKKLIPAKSVDSATATRQARNKSILMPKPENFIGSTLEYPIVDGYLYRVLTSPNEITAIELPPGCRFHAESPYIGDMRTVTPASAEGEPEPEPEPNWEHVKSAHGSRSAPVAKVLVRPRVAGLETTLQADTDCGAFRYKLVSTQNSANETVRFRKELSEMGFPESPPAEERQASSASASACDNMPVASAHFGYEVSGANTVWAPQANQIFHNGKKDGGKTCVKMSEALAADEYPTALLPSSGGESTIYGRVTEGGYMEFDKVLPLILLRLGDEDVKVRLVK